MSAPAVGTILGELTLERVLLDVDGPKLFTCVAAGGQRYLANAVDEDDENGTISFVYLAVSDERLPLILSGAIPLRDAFTDAESEYVWLVRSQVSESSAEAWTLKADEIPDRWLPSVDAVLQIEIPTQPAFSLEMLHERSKAERRTLIALQLDVNDDLRTEYPVAPLGQFLLSFQGNMNAQGRDINRELSGRLVKEQTELVAVDLAAASFVTVLAPRTQGRLFEDDLARQSAYQLVELLDSSDAYGRLRTALEAGLDLRAATRLRDLLQVAKDRDSGIGIYVAEPDSAAGGRATRSEVESLLGILLEVETSTEELEVSGLELVGFNSRTLSFELFDPVEERRYKGKVEPALATTIDELTIGARQRYEATLLETMTYAPFAEKPKYRYTLVAISPWTLA